MKFTTLLGAAVVYAGCTTSNSEPTRPLADGNMGRVIQAPASAPHRALTKSEQRATARELSQTLAYYDGSTRRTLFVSNDVVAEFAPSEAGRNALLHSSADGSELDAGQAAVRLWRVRAMPDAETFTRNLTGESLSFSPVLHEGPSSQLPMVALPGGVIASFPSAWTRAEVDAWLAVRKLSAERELVPGSNMFLVPTRPGLEALDVANRLYETGELVACTPNWWRQAAVR